MRYYYCCGWRCGTSIIIIFSNINIHYIAVARVCIRPNAFCPICGQRSAIVKRENHFVNYCFRIRSRVYCICGRRILTSDESLTPTLASGILFAIRGENCKNWIKWVALHWPRTPPWGRALATTMPCVHLEFTTRNRQRRPRRPFTSLAIAQFAFEIHHAFVPLIRSNDRAVRCPTLNCREKL